MSRQQITFTPAFDRRDRDPSKDYGIHGVELHMGLVRDDEERAVSFTLFTQWQLPHVRLEMTRGHRLLTPIPASVAFHRATPWSPDDESSECDLLLRGHCYTRHTGYQTPERIYGILLTQGSDGIWEEFERLLEDPETWGDESI